MTLVHISGCYQKLVKLISSHLMLMDDVQIPLCQTQIPEIIIMLSWPLILISSWNMFPLNPSSHWSQKKLHSAFILPYLFFIPFSLHPYLSLLTFSHTLTPPSTTHHTPITPPVQYKTNTHPFLYCSQRRSPPWSFGEHQEQSLRAC